ncbi:hypothetical protein D5045_25465 [Verminephrobacter eiseniae]|nr:hypothetical protein [Verminephrobacter eiseniae]
MLHRRFHTVGQIFSAAAQVESNPANHILDSQRNIPRTRRDGWGRRVFFRHHRLLWIRLVSRHRSDVVGCAQPSERSARRIACPYRAVLASDATPRCASMASADRQMIGDATLASVGVVKPARDRHRFVKVRIPP